MPRNIDPKKYEKADKLLAKGKTFEETRHVLQSLYGSAVSRTTLTQLNKNEKK